MRMHRPPTTARLLAALAALGATLVTGCGDAAVTGPEVGATPRFAASAGGGVASNTTFPVTFTLRAGRCGLTTDVTATGEFHAIVRTTTGDDGRTLAIGFNNSAHGTAVGADGTRYVWSYHNNRRRDNYTGARPFDVHWTDHFVLVGRGRAPDVHTFFNVYFTIEVDGSRTYVRNVTIGDPDNCDPI
jgi:hypothetical protein